MSDAFSVTETPPEEHKLLLPEKLLEPDSNLTMGLVHKEVLRPVLGSLIQKCSDLEDQNKRLEDDHYREKRSFFLKLFAVLDSLDRLLRQADPDNEVVESVEEIRNQFLEILEDQEVMPVDLEIGALFDPLVCEVSSSRVRPDLEPDLILAVDRRGYTWNAKALRKARVVISKKA